MCDGIGSRDTRIVLVTNVATMTIYIYYIIILIKAGIITMISNTLIVSVIYIYIHLIVL